MISKIDSFILILNLGKTRYSMETKLTLDTSHYQEGDYTLSAELPSIVARVLDIPEKFVTCHKMDDIWWLVRSENDEILVRLLNVYDEEQMDEMNKMCDVINSSSFVTNINSEIGKIKELADGKVTLNKTEPLVKVLTGRQSILWISSITFENTLDYLSQT